MTIEERRKYDREWYLKNKERLKSVKKINSNKSRDKRRKAVIEYLKLHPCVDCGEKDIIVLEFDHIDPSEKYNTISDLVSKGPWSALMEEIKKCEIRCANCHRRKTAKQFNLYKYESVL